jgi:hypothetical protein
VFTIWRLKYERWRMQGKFDKARQELRVKKAPQEEFAYLDGDEFHTMSEFQEEFDRHNSGRLWRQASELDLEMPQSNQEDMFRYTDDGQHRYLSAKGRNHVRKLIDAEKALRFEIKTMWVTKIILPLLGVLIGLIGALTGFFCCQTKKSTVRTRKKAAQV